MATKKKSPKKTVKAKPKPKTKAKAPAKSKKKPKPKVKQKPVGKKVVPKKAQPVPKKAQTIPKKKASPPKKASTPRKSEPAKPQKAKKTGKILAKNFLVDLATHIKEAVVPEMTNIRSREIVGSAQSGDTTFHLDIVAEKALLNFLRSAKAPVVYYSEDAGYTTFTNDQPTHLLVIDPIDGSRAAKNGFEACVVSICATRVLERPTVEDIDNAIVMELTQDRYFYAEREGGARAFINGHSRKIKLVPHDDIERMAWSMTVPARPAELIFPVSAKLIDISSLKGGFFACNSSAYSLTRLLTNQLDACIDIANRFYRDIPDAVEDSFINAGRGVVLGVYPYDFAAALLIVQEAGCVVTDAYGEGFDDVLLLDSSPQNQHSIVAATNKDLHAKLLGYYDTRIIQLEELLQARYEATVG
jgi:myo-inositol-1(or 4)-monophosphatase